MRAAASGSSEAPVETPIAPDALPPDSAPADPVSADAEDTAAGAGNTSGDAASNETTGASAGAASDASTNPDAQKAPGKTGAPARKRFAPGDTYVIKNVTYTITGLVLENALEERLQLRVGQTRFASKEEFEAHIANKIIEIRNMRTLKSNSSLRYTARLNPATKEYEADITADIFAEFSILILPFFSYSSSSGLLLSARGRDYNFLGSLEPLSANLDYRYDENGRHLGGFSASFTYPFAYKKNFFRLSVNESISYRDDNKFDNNNALTLGYLYPILPFLSFNASLSQAFVFATDEDVAGRPILASGNNTLSTGLGITLTPRPLPVIQNIVYSPSVSLYGTYSLDPHDPRMDERTGITPSVNQSISFGQVNEVGDFRRGMSVSIGNNNSYALAKGEGWLNSLTLDARLHGAFWDRLGFDVRVYGVQNFYTYSNPSEEIDKGSSLGDNLRGVIDNKFENVRGGLAANMAVLVRMFDIKPFVSVYLSVFSDIGVRMRTDDPANPTRPFDYSKDFKATVGVEVLAFAIFARSIVFRISYGIDVTRVVEEGGLASNNREIFIGLGRYF